MSYLHGGASAAVPGLGEPAPGITPRLVFVPGVMGSGLFDNASGRMLWGSNEMLMWAPSMGSWVSAMGQGDGVASGGRVVPRGFLRLFLPLTAVSPAARVLGLHDIDIHPYGDALRLFVSALGPDNVLPFPYDWRLGNDHTAALLKLEIERKWGDTLTDPARPLTIVAHSMGGLVSRYYIEQLGGSRVVRNLVTVGTPHDGAPEALLIPTHLPSLARFLVPLEAAAWIGGLVVPSFSPISAAMPLLSSFVTGFLRELQTLMLHFSSLHQMLPGYPFVIAGGPAPEPLATTYATFARDMCLDAARRGRRQVCIRAPGDLGRFGDLLHGNAQSLPSSVNYFPIVSHTLATTIQCARAPSGGLAAIRTPCGDATVPARSAALPPAANVSNRFLQTLLAHSDLLRDPRVLRTCLNVARMRGALPVAGVTTTRAVCVPPVPLPPMRIVRPFAIPA